MLSQVLGCKLEAHDDAAGSAGEDVEVVIVDVVDGAEEQPDPPRVYVSAEGDSGVEVSSPPEQGGNHHSYADTTAAGRELDDADIHQVVEGRPDLILSLNKYRGLQIIDVSDTSSPEIVGAVPFSGTPVEMYQVDDQVLVLLNDWRAYQRESDDLLLRPSYRSGVLVVDVSDVDSPRVVDQEPLGGRIMTSNLARGGDGSALYVASDYSITSLMLSDSGELQRKADHALDGPLLVIRATPEHLVTSRRVSQRGWRSEIALFDTSSPDGVMIESEPFSIDGLVSTRHGISVRGDVLRMVTSGRIGASAINHVQTYDVSDMDAVVSIDREAFGYRGDGVSAVLFDANTVFIAGRGIEGSLRAFEIADDGTIDTERIYGDIVGGSGQLAAVNQSTRLIQVKRVGSTVEVGLHDVTGLSNEASLIDRVGLGFDVSWSGVYWDERAFRVLEDVTSVPSADGTATETGVVLLPFVGFDDVERRHVTAVQVFTFSDATITSRGTMNHGSVAHRSFMTNRANAAAVNLSDAELSTFALGDLDVPEEQGRVELAPSYADITVFGAHGVRHHHRSDFCGSWSSRGQSYGKDALQIISMDGDIERAPPEAIIEIDPRSRTYRVGDSLVSISARSARAASHTGSPHSATVEVWDLSTPTLPTLVSTVFSASLGAIVSGGDSAGASADCESGALFEGFPEVEIIGDAMVVPTYEPARAVWRKDFTRDVYLQNGLSSAARGCLSIDDATLEEHYYACEYYQGSYHCSRSEWADGTKEPEVCTGGFEWCVQDDAGERTCEEVDVADVDTMERGQVQKRMRHWVEFAFRVIDVSDPNNPTISGHIATDDGKEHVGVFTHEGDLYIHYKTSVLVRGDARSYVSYWLERVDMRDPSSPVFSAPISVPGQLIAVDGDKAIAKSFDWVGSDIETSLVWLEWAGERLVPRGAPYRLEGRQVLSVLSNEEGDLYVSHRAHGGASYDAKTLSLLEASDRGWSLVSEFEIGFWASLLDVIEDRLLISVPGGMQVVNVQDNAMPRAQSFFPMDSRAPEVTLFGSELLIPAGRFGLHRHDIGGDDRTPRSE